MGEPNVLPLFVAAECQDFDMVVLLLSHGADPSGDSVMYCGVLGSSDAILQLLIDAGGDVNGHDLILTAMAVPRRLQLLLDQPLLNLNVKYNGVYPALYARMRGLAEASELIDYEVC